MAYFGAHLSSSQGFYKMGQTAIKIGADTLQCFVRNPRGAKAKAINPVDLGKLDALMHEHQFGPIVAHAPYIMNPCSKDEGIRALAEDMLRGDLQLMEHLPGNYYNFHPGSHVGQGTEVGITQIADMLNRVLRPDLKTVVLLETMTGKGSEIGGRFEELREIIDRVVCKERIGVCLDTCHVWDGGYDVVGNLDGVVTEFDKVIGLDYLKAVHLNDSMNPLGAKKDRHALLGAGHLGLDAIVRIVTHPALCHLPFNLETPTEDEGHAQEIALLREKIGTFS